MGCLYSKCIRQAELKWITIYSEGKLSQINFFNENLENKEVSLHLSSKIKKTFFLLVVVKIILQSVILR